MLDGYEQWTIGRAEDVLLVQCLNELGFEASVNPDTGTSEETLTHFGPHREYRRYGMARVDLAEEYGFEVPLDDGPRREPYLLAEGFDLEEARTVVDGFSHTGDGIETPSGAPVPEGGCHHQARLRIDPESAAPGPEGYVDLDEGGELPGTHGLAEGIHSESFFAVVDSPEVGAAEADWRGCVRETGYEGAPPGAGEGLGRDDAPLSADCMDASGYLDVFVAQECAFQEAEVEENLGALEERAGELREQVETAREVLDW
ncbi:hypothetical protein GCM10007079_31070 [Nocardiopsis terrae]|uniref:Uncharacterized protein n=1 Tax=Nocardiopsis terrae TaxID=372655 RepID=A0ABR9HIT5_9ACTN|nr:hypothetical protein [Nocardiopsis terrae]MBE1458931.1 hypothetical protein [Nocardiopsis terrae]GHC87188.1 hypothetical protein GCM10007079_31070 [Nocardiopsis terrae]